jgi:hypothetical protein
MESAMQRFLLVALLTFLIPITEEGHLYKAMLIRAAPGKLLEVVSLYKNRMAVYDAGGEERPILMRHSQGDQWDLMILFPVKSYAEYYSPERMARRKKAADQSGLSEAEFARMLSDRVAWREEIFVEGPPLDTVRKAFNGASFYHVEMFLALPGKHAELRRQREMENAYLEYLKRPQNLIFTRDQGAAWDLFTIGCYRDIKHFAESADIPEKEQEAAARAAGFQSADQIGPYLRTLINSHHDTLAVAVK